MQAGIVIEVDFDLLLHVLVIGRLFIVVLLLTGLATSQDYYVWNWDNSQWGAAMLLANITQMGKYHETVRSFLRLWVAQLPPKVHVQDKIFMRQVCGNLLAEHAAAMHGSCTL